VTISKWFASSLTGHIAFFSLIFSVPFFFWGLFTNYADRTLTPDFALEMGLEIAALGVVGATAVWYTITLPLIRRRNK